MSNTECMTLDTGFAIQIGPFQSVVYGGPYRRYKAGQRRLTGIKMAAEINAPCDISIPTKDFSVPPVESMQEGLKEAIQAIARGDDLYVGCMGGIGRTGLFMGCLVKSLQDSGHAPKDDPVLQVRQWYSEHAIETTEQQDYVYNFPTTPVVHEIRKVTAPTLKEIVKREVVEVKVPMTLKETLKALFWFK